VEFVKQNKRSFIVTDVGFCCVEIANSLSIGVMGAVMATPRHFAARVTMISILTHMVERYLNKKNEIRRSYYTTSQ
jgi:hypothetical protein